MKLKNYDNKLVRITTIDDNVYEGNCYHNSKDYDYHEFGVDEESLQIVCFIFYKSDIKKVELIDDFSDKYGLLEKESFESGIDIIEEVFESEEDEHKYRLLLYIEDHIDELKSYKNEMIKQLKTMIKYNYCEKVIKESKKLLKEIED